MPLASLVEPLLSDLSVNFWILFVVRGSHHFTGCLLEALLPEACCRGRRDQ